MSYNIKGHGTLFAPRHIEGIAEVIREARPDIAGLQEVHRGGWRARRQDQIGELERLTGMNVLFGRSFAKGAFTFGNALLTRGRIVDSAIATLPGRGEPRTLLRATVDLDGVELDAFVTHLAAWGRLGGTTRLAQAKAVAERVGQSDRPFVLMGDFNSTPTSGELEVFHHGNLMTSCFPEPIVTYRLTRQCLDYIFVQPGWQVRSARVLQQGPSDHWPLIAELEEW
jgi:endonuclease/exonuclease/phosphatase family metal-dependent hydrolase